MKRSLAPPWRLDREFAAACRAVSAVLFDVGCPPLHPSTLPDAVAADQELACEGAARRTLAAWRAAALRPDDPQLIECVSLDADLPPWTVHRRLAALGLVAPPRSAPSAAERKRSGETDVALVRTFLASLGSYATLREIAAGTGLSRAAVRAMVRWEPSPFKRIRVPRADPGVGRFAYQSHDFRG